jgi:hypothetical protein
MADISLGTFEVTALSSMNPGSMTPPGGTPVTPTSNISLVMLNPPAGVGPASLTVSGLPSGGTGPAPLFATTVTLGKAYEIVFREVPPVR